MSKLKLGTLQDDKPVKLTIELPAQVHRDLVVYAELLGQDGASQALDPTRLVAPMLERFMATDREFARRRRTSAARVRGDAQGSESA